jgi:hypothetical protein
MSVHAKLKENTLRIELPLLDEPKVSGSGKNIVVASVRDRTGVNWKGQEIYLIAHAFVWNTKYDSKKTSRSH